jgi:hypothetical protein
MYEVQFEKRRIKRPEKSKFHEAMVVPVLTRGAEAWACERNRKNDFKSLR